MPTINAKSIDGVSPSNRKKEVPQSASISTAPIRALGVGLMMAGAAAAVQPPSRTAAATVQNQ